MNVFKFDGNNAVIGWKLYKAKESSPKPTIFIDWASFESSIFPAIFGFVFEAEKFYKQKFGLQKYNITYKIFYDFLKTYNKYKK